MPHPTNEVRCFHGLTYNPERVDVGRCLCRPYDVISPEQQARYYDRDEANAVRLVLGKQHPDDHEADNRYTRARDTLADWLEEGILIGSELPSVWVYTQEYEVGGRLLRTTDALATVRLQSFEERRILPHEKVMKGPVEDRIRLTLTTGCQMEPIWSFYRDERFDIADLAKGRPLLDHTDPDTGVRHQLWKTDDPEQCAAVSSALSAGPIYIADGHHRYQTMLHVRDRLRERHPGAGPGAPWEFILMYLVNEANQPLTVLPYHRLLSGLPGRVLESFPRSLAQAFRVEEMPYDASTESSTRSAWLERLEKEGTFGAAVAGRQVYYLIKERSGTDRLDVEVLNDTVLGAALGITEEDLREKEVVTYSHDTREALESVRRGSAQAAFLMRATPVEAIVARADAGGVMPRKSSFFYPKPLSGLVFYPMEERS